MKDDNDHINLNLLIDYVENSVTEDTRKRIDEYLGENEEERLVVDGIRTYYQKYGMDRESMLAYLQDSRDTSLAELEERTAPKRIMPQTIGWAAALLLLCLSVGAYLFVEKNNSVQSELAAYLSEPYSATIFMSDQEPAAWMEAYENGDYQHASALLDNLIQGPQSHDAQLLFFAGLSHLYQQPPQPKQAIAYLSQVNDETYGEQAQWYLALAYLLNEQPTEAKVLLEDIVANQTYHNEEAAELLK